MTPTGLEVRRAASNSPEVSTFQAAQFTDALKRVYQAKAIRAFVCISSDMMMDALINQPVTFTKRGFGAENRGRHILGRYYARWRPSQDIASRLEAIPTSSLLKSLHGCSLSQHANMLRKGNFKSWIHKHCGMATAGAHRHLRTLGFVFASNKKTIP